MRERLSPPPMIATAALRPGAQVGLEYAGPRVFDQRLDRELDQIEVLDVLASP